MIDFIKKHKDTLISAANDIISQSWTIFGLLIGWIVLPDGETRNFVGKCPWLVDTYLVCHHPASASRIARPVEHKYLTMVI
jgi:hypothetical protein